MTTKFMSAYEVWKDKQDVTEIGECVSRHPSTYSLTRAQKIEDES